MPKPAVNEAIVRAVQILELLSSAVPYGLPNKDIAQALGDTPSTVTRTLETLIHCGVVRRLPTGNFCIAARYSQQCFRVLASFEAAERQLQDSKRNYTLK